jgi:T5SS/PEP-CTERM-associated repeat protein
MATYTFLGGDFNDPMSWSPQGIPGAGDTIQDAIGAILTAEGQTVANAEAQGNPFGITGGLTIAGDGYDLFVQNGSYSIGVIDGAFSTIQDATVTAGSVNLNLPNIALGLDSTSSLTVSGSVAANGDTIDTFGTFNAQGGVSVTNGTLQVDGGATTIGGELGLDTGSYLILNQGTATVGSLNINGSTVQVYGSASGTTLKVTGAATFSNGGALLTAGGKATFGTLTVDSATGVANAGPTLASSAKSSTIDVMQAGSNLAVVGDLTLGSGADVLDVQNGGTVTAANVTADGTIDVTGAGSSVAVAHTLILGSTSAGALTVAGGAALAVGGAFDMAENAGSSSTATIGDAGATLTIQGLWQIGVAGTATATITQGVTANANGGISLGVQSTGVGTLTVSRANTVLSVTGDVAIGEAGKGTVNVLSGAIVDASGSDVTVGEQDKATGTVKISGAGSQFQAGSLTVGGASSNATVDVSSGGDLEIASDLTLGEQAGSKGTLIVADAGSQVSVGGNATVGAAGSGTLAMTGGALSVTSAMSLGEQKGSSGKLTLSNATMSITGDLNIGQAGSGSATVQLASVLKSKTIQIGGALGASGSLTISGAGTSATAGATTIGAGGMGTLKVVSGGLLTTSGDASIGSVALGAIVSASLDTGGQWLVGGALAVGDSGAGKLSIAGKGTLVTVDGDLTIGVAAGGTVTLGSTAAASSAQLTWNNLLTVGGGAKGTLTINAGDSVSALSGGAGEVAIGANAGSSGAVSFAGTGASLSGTAIFVGGTASAQGGAGSLSISAGGSATFADATIWKTGKVTDAGVLSISGALTGSGSVQISGPGQFTLGGPDSTVGIDFVSGGSNELLDLSTADLPSVAIKGFGANDTIDVSGLSTSDTIGVSSKGAVATVRFLQGAKTVGKLLFANVGPGAFQFDAADGALTFTPAAASGSALSAVDLGSRASAHALALDVLGANYGGALDLTGAAFNRFVGGPMFAGHFGGALLGADASA